MAQPTQMAGPAVLERGTVADVFARSARSSKSNPAVGARLRLVDLRAAHGRC